MRRAEHGQNLVEMALVIPLLLLLLAGVVDFGMAFHDHIVITNAAREGVRIMSRLPCRAGNTTQQQALVTMIVNATLNAATGSRVALGAGDVTIIPNPVGTNCGYTAGSPVTVRVTYSYHTMVGSIIGSIIGSPTLTLRSETTMTWFGND